MLLLNTPFSYMKTLSYDSRKDMNIKKNTDRTSCSLHPDIF